MNTTNTKNSFVSHVTIANTNAQCERALTLTSGDLSQTVIHSSVPASNNDHHQFILGPNDDPYIK